MSNLEKIVDTLSSLTVMEASKLTKMLEETWGVSAAAPVAAAAASSASAEPAAVQTEFEVILSAFDAAKKINVIKVVREITGLGLAEAKAFVESSPKTVKEGATKEEAAKIKDTLEAAGGTIQIK